MQADALNMTRAGARSIAWLPLMVAAGAMLAIWGCCWHAASSSPAADAIRNFFATHLFGGQSITDYGVPADLIAKYGVPGVYVIQSFSNYNTVDSSFYLDQLADAVQASYFPAGRPAP